MITKPKTLLNSDLILSKAEIKKGDKVADLGCGSSGYFIFPVATIVGKKGVVYAVDILKHALDIIEKRAKQEEVDNIKKVWSDLEVFKGTQIETESLDVAFLINTLFQSRKKTEILRESSRLLKKGGKLLIVEWEKGDSSLGPPPESRIGRKELEGIAQGQGLKKEEDFIAGEHHYALVFTKL